MAVKVSDFAKTKARVGKTQFRTHGSKDEKLLSNVKRVIKSVVHTPQSISINKDSINVTSRRLTLAELVAKSRHSSESVCNHALVGILEYTRRFPQDTKLNIFSLVQIASSSLLCQNDKILSNAKQLLVNLVTVHLSTTASENKCIECIYKHLLQGILSSSLKVRCNIYKVIDLLLSRAPSVLRLHCNDILEKCIADVDNVSFHRINCIYELSKVTKVDGVAPFALSYLQRLHGAQEPSDELDCLSMANCAVKLFKLILANAIEIENVDLLISLLLEFELAELDGMTEMGIKTFEQLRVHFNLTRSDIALELMERFPSLQALCITPLLALAKDSRLLDRFGDQVSMLILRAMQIDEWEMCFTIKHSKKVNMKLLMDAATAHLHLDKIKQLYTTLRDAMHDFEGSNISIDVYVNATLVQLLSEMFKVISGTKEGYKVIVAHVGYPWLVREVTGVEIGTLGTFKLLQDITSVLNDMIDSNVCLDEILKLLQYSAVDEVAQTLKLLNVLVTKFGTLDTNQRLAFARVFARCPCDDANLEILQGLMLKCAAAECKTTTTEYASLYISTLYSKALQLQATDGKIILSHQIALQNLSHCLAQLLSLVVPDRVPVSSATLIAKLALQLLLDKIIKLKLSPEASLESAYNCLSDVILSFVESLCIANDSDEEVSCLQVACGKRIDLVEFLVHFALQCNAFKLANSILDAFSAKGKSGW